MNAISIIRDTELEHQLIRAQLAKFGLRWVNCVSWNAPDAALFQQAVERAEGIVTATRALAVSTGTHTGRSPKDKFIVRNSATETTVWWDNTQAMSQQQFEKLRADMLLHARMSSLFVQDLVAGADDQHALAVRVVTEQAWQALFIRHLLRKPERDAASPKLHIICLPSFKADPARHGTRSETVIAMDLKAGIVLIGGTNYAGEIKKSVFSVLNHLLPDQNVLPMHCSANVGEEGDTAIFFGLSGTGKTTLSTDPYRMLVGDDEHGWSDRGIFNIEGGCYAKAINLSAEKEPEIFAAAQRAGSVLENVVIDPKTRQPDFADVSKTENTRIAYSLDAIANASATGIAGHPKAIIMLTCDAFGVLPPIARLTPDQAVFHFMSGYTAKVAGTERGITEPQATFSACFGAPFLTRHPMVYAKMLRERMKQHNVLCYLVNTGWSGGGVGVGQRMPLAFTRSIIRAALAGDMERVAVKTDPTFGFAIPMALSGVEASLLDPRKAWASSAAYDVAAHDLVQRFISNFQKFGGEAQTLLDAGLAHPVRLAAE
jgi:phosphoenolpyruvate carboxykinase (ATP)